jgi:AcrR family transcriptional regulator
MTVTAKASAPRRRPGAGGYARGEETRARIVGAALEVFAEVGYERASTRQIAEAAGVTPPALQYYFDSKEGLHRACAHFIIEEVWEALAPTRQAAEAAIEARRPSGALDALCDFLEAIAGVSLAAPGAPDRGRFIGRAQADGAGPAAAIVREAVSRPLHAILSGLISVILSQPAEAEAIRLRASAILGPISVFHASRANTLAILDWPDYEGERLAAVKAMLRAHTRAALGSGDPERG